jgi:aryl-alcohol dehydrogenase-like predicted oxidoreductase
METRRFGRTGHMSTVAVFGAAAFGQVSQAEADKAMEEVIMAGVNHIDVAPSYGKAEERLGPWLARERGRFFVGCKTMERAKAGAEVELRQSLERLKIDHFNLYQIHAITSMEELDEVTRSGGALEALIGARDAGLIDYIGITGHGVDVPAILLEALRRFDFDSVLFPINFVQYGNSTYRKNTEELLQQCRAKDVGIMVIKSIAKGPWGEQTKTHDTWYHPFTDADQIQQAVDFVLSQDVTGLCTAGDIKVLPLVLRACENFTALTKGEQEELIDNVAECEPLFT